MKIRQYFITFSYIFLVRKLRLKVAQALGLTWPFLIEESEKRVLVLGRKKETDHGIQLGIQQKNSRCPLFVARHLFCVEKKVDNRGCVQYQYKSSFTC